MTAALTRYAGLTVSPAVWLINTQLGQILPYGDCSAGARWTTAATLACAVIAFAAAFLSLKGHSRMVSRSDLFVTRVAFFFGLSFAFALTLQGVATVLIAPCLH